MGVSIAHHLALRGCGKIVLLEKTFIGAGSSGKSGAIIRQHYSTSLLVKMARHGVQVFSDFASHTGHACGWDAVGCLIVGHASERAAMEGNVALMRQTGAKVLSASGSDLTDLFPQGIFNESDLGAWESEAGYVDPAAVLYGYSACASRRGAVIRLGVEVTGILKVRGSVTGVSTSKGVISSGATVLCAGPWAARMAATCVLALPLTVIRPELAIYRRAGDFGAPTHPVLADMRNGFYTRPDSGERSLVGALDISSDQIIENPDCYDESVSPEFLAWTRSRASVRIPAMKHAFGRGGYSGLYTLSPDSHPMLGRAPGLENLYLAAGFSGHGFKLSPAVGRGIAELLLDGAYSSLDMTPLRPERFAQGQPVKSAYEYGLLS